MEKVYCGRQLSPSSRRHQVASLEDIPLDIIHLIADISPCAQDLVALSTVSKRLWSLLSDRAIWEKLYRKSTLRLPPGPYDWQSTSFLISALLRSERFRAAWPSSSTCLKTLLARSARFSGDATFCVLLGRWLLAAEGSTLVCYDSYRNNMSESAVTLHDSGGVKSDRILQVFSVGNMQEDGVLAIVVLLFKETFTIAKVIMDRERPSRLQTILTSEPTVIGRQDWTNSVDVRLYHHLLVMDNDSSGCLAVMDIGTLRRYHIPPLTDGAPLDLTCTTTFFFAIRTHFMRVTSCIDNFGIHSTVECFPLLAIPGASESDVLCPSHEGQVIHSLIMDECNVIHESPPDLDSGKTSFRLCGLAKSEYGGAMLKIMDINLEPEGSVSLTESPLIENSIKMFSVGCRGGHGVSVAALEQTPLFALRHDHRAGYTAFMDHVFDHRFRGSELLGLDTLAGMVFLARHSGNRTSVEIVDLGRDAEGEGDTDATGPHSCVHGNDEHGLSTSSGRDGHIEALFDSRLTATILEGGPREMLHMINSYQ